jgi:SAM-dependent methyltransferase
MRSPEYCCTIKGCVRARLEPKPGGLGCTNGHLFPYAIGTDVPVFASEPPGTTEYSLDNAAEMHDNALRWVFNTFNDTEHALRERLIARIGLSKGDRVLVTGAGAGNDLPFLVRGMDGYGEIYAQDVSKEMLLAAARRHGGDTSNSGVMLRFSVSDALSLPFADGYFDAAYHFGGINLFPDIAAGVAEMNRVVRDGGKVVFGDEGVAPWLSGSELGQMLINNNPLYACEVPLKALPPTARAVKLSWELGNCFYVIEFEASTSAPQINLDVPHVGKRGGTIRSRYFGRLEGVDPSLRDLIYEEASRRGVSRVAFLESALREFLQSKGK